MFSAHYVTIYLLFFYKFLLSTFAQKLCNSLVARSCNSNSELSITICFVYFLDSCFIPCNLRATCQAGNCVCKPGYHGDGILSCTKGNVLDTTISLLYLYKWQICYMRYAIADLELVFPLLMLSCK